MSLSAASLKDLSRSSCAANEFSKSSWRFCSASTSSRDDYGRNKGLLNNPLRTVEYKKIFNLRQDRQTLRKPRERMLQHRFDPLLCWKSVGRKFGGGNHPSVATLFGQPSAPRPADWTFRGLLCSVGVWSPNLPVTRNWKYKISNLNKSANENRYLFLLLILMSTNIIVQILMIFQ